MENDVTSSTQELDVAGGWLITHWTRTWDTRAPLAQIDNDLQAAEAELQRAQEKRNAIAANKVAFQKEIDDAQAAAQTLKQEEQSNATSTPSHL